MNLVRWNHFAALLLTACNNSIVSGPLTGIGPEGGRIESPDGNAALVIPAGALTGRFDLTLAAVGSVGLDAARYGGSGYRVSPTAVTFSVPATLTIKTDSAKGPIGTSRRDLVILRTAGTGAVVPANPAATAGTGTATIASGGDFAVAWQPSGTCSAAELRQFDFWIGHWRYDAVGAATGDQTITVEQGGCGIREQFVQGTYRGSSISTRSTAGDWYQTFIDSDGGRIILKGSFANGVMTLYETPTKRFLWRASSATVVSFTGEESADNGQTWRQTFAATYTKVP